ncbi:hypothetical protein F4810DRAFT_708534 [Camillea tinctor]|nr:hypothetical protein F4810DRAFT_708534 [Camillea tinctor]
MAWGRTSSGADQNRRIDCVAAQNGKQRRCPTCLLAMEKEDSSNADEEGASVSFSSSGAAARRQALLRWQETTEHPYSLKTRAPRLDLSPSATVYFLFLARPDSLNVADEYPSYPLA